MRTSLLLCLLAVPACVRAESFDVVVYGGTSGGVAAAVQARRMGKSVLLIEPGKHVGGMTTGGLGATDTGNQAAIGGMAREFYHRIYLHYQSGAAWKHGTREKFADAPAQNTRAVDSKNEVMWVFEPSAAEEVFGEQRNVVAARAQRRHLDRDDVQPVVEIAAKTAVRDFRFEALVRRGDHAHVDADGLLAADFLERLLLQHAQHLGLRAQTHVADLVEEERSAVGQLEFSFSLINGACERSLSMSEEL